MSSSKYDVCIVGAGIAGSLLAENLARSGARVALIEAGRKYELHERLTNLQRSSIVGGPVWPWLVDGRDDYVDASQGQIGYHYALNELRVKGVGGSTLHWGGLAQRLLPSDFEVRNRYGMASDWPISYDELEPWYVEAEREIGVAGSADPEEPPRSADFPMPAFPPSWQDNLWVDTLRKRGMSFGWTGTARNSVPYRGRSHCVAYKVCRVCPSGARYSADFHAGLAVETGRCDLFDLTVARRIDFDRPGHVRAIHATALDGRTLEISAGQFVIAAHGIESARLMLLSGMGRYLDQIGRNLMEHWYLGIGGYQKDQLYPGRIGFSTMESNALYEGEARSERGAIKLEFSKSEKEVLTMGMDAGLSGGELDQYDREHFGFWLNLGAEVEHQPNPDSRVTLDDLKTDRFGDPVPKVAFALSEVDKRTNQAAKDVVYALLADRKVKDPQVLQEFGPGAHHMGTCRMGVSADDSVTDRDCRVHGVENLYCAGSSVFTTSGARQPTLTIAALALRLAGHLRQKRA